MSKQSKLSISLISLAVLITGCGSSEPPTEVAVVEEHPGKAIYTKYCKVCHAQGLNGAPIVGNEAMWGPRVEKGEAALVESAKNGFGLMPANLGRKPELDEATIASAVSYMLSEL